MRKSDKKLDNQLCLSLTRVCETALKQIDGFQWITHSVNYANFPQSLRIICVFDTNQNIEQCKLSGNQQQLQSLISNELAGLGIKLKQVAKQVIIDSEENCVQQHDGNWARRLRTH